MRRNPTIFSKFYQLEYHLEKLAKSEGNYPTHLSFLGEVQSFPGKFSKDEFVGLLMSTICHSGQVRSTLDHDSTMHSATKKTCQGLIKDILYYFIAQHPVNNDKLRRKLSNYLADFTTYLEETIDRIYKQQPNLNQLTIGPHLQHLENVLTVTRVLNPYKLDIVSLNNYLGSFSVELELPTNLIASMGMMTSIAGFPETLQLYIEKTDSICDLLNPFQDTRIYNYNDLHGLHHIFSSQTADLKSVLLF